MPISAGALAAGASWFAAAALVPIVIALLARRRALATGRRADEAWFGYARFASWFTLLVWILWPLVVHFAGGTLARALGRSGFGIAATLMSVAVVTPPLLTTLALVLIGQDVSRRLRGDEVSPRDDVVLALLQIGTLAALVGAIASGTFLMLAYRYQAGVLAVVAGMTLALWIQGHHRRRSALELHAVTAGQLRDRLWALAAAARVPLRQLFVVPMARRRLPNAFAVRGDTVILTDVLLARLSRRQVDAVLAHEIAHLAMKHPRRIALAFAVVLAPGAVFLYLTHRLAWIGLVVLAAYLVRLAVARRFEFAADAAAVRLCGDPEALISGLALMGRVSGVPQHWSRRAEWFLTHPSTDRRIERIAAAGGVAASRVAALMTEDAPSEHYDLPPALAGGGKVFSSVLKRRIVQRLVLVRLAAVIATPAFLLAFAGATLERGTLFAASLLIGFLLLLLVHERAAASAIARLERPLRARHAGDPHPEFVSLAPGAGHRVYEGFFEWDLGLLTLSPGRLAYRGEETAFTLAPGQVTAIEVVRGPRAWIRSARVQVTWRDAADTTRTFNLRPARVKRVSLMLPAAQALAARLEAWRSGTPLDATPALPVAMAAAAGPSPIGLPPTIEAVSGDALTRVTSPRAFARSVPMLLVFSLVACVLSGLPLDPFQGPGWLDVFGVALGASLLAHLPYWLPAPGRRAATAQPRPAEAA